MDGEKIVYLIEDNIAILTINNPPANTLNSFVLEELENKLNSAFSDENVRAIIITGEGKMFVAGADIKEIDSIATKNEAIKLAKRGQQLFTRIENSSKPIIAAINGACLGGGFELALACHMRIADERAKFGLPEITLGLIPGFGGTQRLSRLTNKGIAYEWILTGGMHEAEGACKLGIINKVTKPGTVVEEALALAKLLVSKSMVTTEKALKAITNGIESNLEKGLEIEADLFGEVCITEDKSEGVKAFLEKRKPVFKDK